MELNYKVLGPDGKEYGPATLAEINAWLREGRINGETQLTRSDIDYWAPASHYSELVMTRETAAAPSAAVRPVQTASSPIAVQPRNATMPAGTDSAAAAQLKSGASWFYWIAGLSVVNSIIAFSGSGGGGFVVGLGVTQLIDGFGQSMEGGGKMVAIFLDVIAAGIFVLFGVFANKQHTWAFIVGMLLYALDGLLFLLFQLWLGLGFHAFVLFCLFRGFQACRALNAG
jgi:hypothetical protein